MHFSQEEQPYYKRIEHELNRIRNSLSLTKNPNLLPYDQLRQYSNVPIYSDGF